MPVTQLISKVGVVSFVMLSVDEEPRSEAAARSGVPVAAGAEVSTVMESAEESTLVLLAASRAVATMELTPAERVMSPDQLPDPSAVTVCNSVPALLVR